MGKKKIIARGTCVDLAMFHWMYQKEQMSIWSLSELSGPLDLKKVKKAAGALLKQVPILTARYKKGFYLGYWQENPWVLNDNSWVDRCIITKDYPMDLEASEALSSVLSIPVSMEEPPYLKITLITNPDRQYLVLQVHHATMDGEGLKKISCLFAENYRKAVSDKLPEIIVPFDMNRSWGQFYSFFTLKDYLLSPIASIRESFKVLSFLLTLKNSGSVFSGNEKLKHPCEYYYKTAIIDLSFTAGLKEKGITVNDLLMTALLLTLNQWNKRAKLRFTSIFSVYTANMRRWWGEPRGTFGNMSVIRLLQVSEKELRSFCAAHKSIKKSIGRDKNEFGLKEIWDLAGMLICPNIVASLLGKVLKRVVKKIHGLTNIGVIPHEAGDFGNVKAKSMSILAPPLEAPCVVFTVTGFQKQLTIHGTFEKNHLPKEKGAEIMNLFQKKLHLLVQELSSKNNNG